MKNDQSDLSCARAHELAGAWLDGALVELQENDPGCDERELRVHLAQCAECREFVADARAMRGELRALANTGAIDLWPRIEASLGRDTRRSPVMRWPARIAAALVGGIGVWTLARVADSRGAEPDALLTNSIARMSSIATPSLEMRRVAATPERTLMLALAAREGERR